MRFVYSEWDDELFAHLRNLRDLMSVYNYLLVRLGGDVEAALRAMRELQKGYLCSS